MSTTSLSMRFVLLFLRVERTRCGEPECRCKNHEVVSPTPLAWYCVLAFYAVLAFAFMVR